jgi:hypothetical protein
MTGNERASEDVPGNGGCPKGRWMRLSEQTRAALQAWANKQPDKPTLAEAIRRLIETGVTD